MNQIDEKKLIAKAKQKFPKHKWLYVYVKKNAFTPYEKSYFHKFIADSKKPLNHKKYILYIHEDYLKIRSDGFIFEPVVDSLYPKLWIELFCIFAFRSDTDNIDLMENTDDEPI